jgi:NAD+ synthase
MVDLSIDTKKTKQTIIRFLREESGKAGFSKAVVGLSGGIDSSLSCFLAVEAFGADNVLGICMPYKTSSPDSLTDAQQVITQLGIQSKVIPITAMADALIELDPLMDAVRRGNIMARMRMIVLYDQSAVYHGLVIGTGNKTEALLGYTTLYGDSACALSPLGDLYKTQIRQLAREMGIPERIIAKPPTADLWKGQTDEGELGFTYAEVDQVLHLLVDENLPPGECIKAGYSMEFIQRAIDRMQANEFKRRLPPIALIA